MDIFRRNEVVWLRWAEFGIRIGSSVLHPCGDARGHPLRVRRVYLGLAFLLFFSVLPVSRINNLCAFSASRSSIPTAPTKNRVHSVALALSSADYGHKKQGFWSKVGPKPDQTKKEADSLRIGLSLYRIIAMPLRIVLSLEKPFPIGHQRTLRRRARKRNSMSGETSLRWCRSQSC